jgi:hypothetical protein
MELLGIVLSIPVAFVISVLYCFFLARVVRKLSHFIGWLRAGFYLILTLFVVELLLLIVLGTGRSNSLIGRGFYAMHIAIFLLGIPAVANLLVLSERKGMLSKWYVAAVVCTVFAFLQVLIQYAVSESLYGIE